jgi:hypothetical protein
MERYKNLSRRSGVYAFEIGFDFIKVQFNSRRIYTYNYQVTGLANIEHMKKLARSGVGLNSFIQRKVRNLFVK